MDTVIDITTVLTLKIKSLKNLTLLLLKIKINMSPLVINEYSLLPQNHSYEWSNKQVGMTRLKAHGGYASELQRVCGGQ